MVVRREDDTTKVHLSEISSVVLQTNQVFVSAYLLSELAKAKVTFVVSDEKCNPVGQYLPLYGAHNTSKRIAEQMEWSEPIKKRVWQRIVRDKIKHQSDVLHARAREEQGEHLRVLSPRSAQEIQRIARGMRHESISMPCLVLSFHVTTTLRLTQRLITGMQFCYPVLIVR